jgi:hypothetical protein
MDGTAKDLYDDLVQGKKLDELNKTLEVQKGTA